MKNFQWSEHQNIIFDTILDAPTSSFIVDACAGSSKTTTLVELVNRMTTGAEDHTPVPPARILCLAFNKKIAMALAERMTPGVTSSTLNALGHRALSSFLPVKRLKVNGWKEANLWREHPAFASLERSDQKAIVDAYCGVKIAGAVLPTKRFSREAMASRTDTEIAFLARQTWKPISTEAPGEIFATYLARNTSDLDPRDWIELMYQVMTTDLLESLAGSISFLDQLYLSATLGSVSLPTYPHVFVDEAQDLGSLEHRLVRRVVSRYPAGRLIAVGDRAQAIYAFKGAHYDSLDRIAEVFSASWLALPISFRCPQAVVREAQTYDSRIQPWSEAPEGQVSWLDSWTLSDLPRPSTILCRMNYPLVHAAIELIQAGIGAHFLGRDLEEVLTSFFDKWRKKSKILPGMFLAIEAEVKEKESKRETGTAARMADNLECLRAIATNAEAESFEALGDAIKTLFNTPGPITLATIHKAKGLEWPHVFLIRPDLLPHPAASSPEDLQQESNMAYVAITRAQESFTYLAPKG